MNYNKISLGIIGNTLNLLYNIPFMYQVYKNSDTKNISTCFLILRILGSLSWIAYGIIDEDNWIIISYFVTLSSSSFVSYYKIRDKINKKTQTKTNGSINNDV